ncbi:MAG: membrane protein insertase YidC, partial [Odoribacter sp.]|nr:membrane protein insertase YidC [Odoribacter sp.]
MDKNTITGLVIIFLILIGFSYFTRPSEEQVRAMQRQQDSIARVEQERMELAARQQQEKDNAAAVAVQKDTIFSQDSLENKTIILENDKVRLHIATQGGRISFVELKEYRTHDSLPLILWRSDESRLGLNFYARNQQINTEKFLFIPSTTETNLYAKDKEQALSMRLYADPARTQYVEFVYKLSPDSYMADFDIVTRNMGNVIASNSSFLTLFWGVNMPQLEKSKEFENRYTGVYYKLFEDDVENMSLTSDEKE